MVGDLTAQLRVLLALGLGNETFADRILEFLDVFEADLLGELVVGLRQLFLLDRDHVYEKSRLLSCQRLLRKVRRKIDENLALFVRLGADKLVAKTRQK